MIVVFGALGQIGSLVLSDLVDTGLEVIGVDVGLNDNFESESGDTLIWCATSSPPHEQMAPFCDDAIAFINLLKRDWKRIIFTSSFGIENGDWVVPVNPYAAGKIASEAFVESWCRLDGTRSGVSIRMGGYGPLTDASMPWAMNAGQIVDAYREALSMQGGYYILKPLSHSYEAPWLPH
ncbi:hypothetical protein GOZ83_19885 [Agrobacterium vitis]|uniref:NAD-dependent epimerase/dehydratase family protein n=1 Tax=Agrobacterium vitis TaxID=373 RepID=UPI0012E88C75|nr:NAD(P)-dependent oxidoreductase [Agrobacterium vitis]MVA47318.1 hypothetical protein [Agrobacterium vitis]